MSILQLKYIDLPKQKVIIYKIASFEEKQ